MTPRATSWIAGIALFAAAAALAVALVAAIRAGKTAQAAGQGAMQMGGAAMAEHMAPAPMEGVRDAEAVRGGQVLKPKIQGGVWTFDLTATPVRWEIVEGTRVTAWTYNGTVPGPELRVPTAPPTTAT